MIYQVSGINQHGDSIDVASEIKNIAEARRLADLSRKPADIVATVIEAFIWINRGGRFVNREYRTMETTGDIKALIAGGWITEGDDLPKPDTRLQNPEPLSTNKGRLAK